MFGWFKRREKRASGSGYTADLMASRAAFIAGTSGLGELTAAVQTCVSMWEAGFAMADVAGTDLLRRNDLALFARSLALRGESMFLIRDRLVPASDWEVSTRDGIPRAYRLTIPDAGGSRTETALAAEVLHVRLSPDPAAPWAGQSPLRRASISAQLLHAVETVLRDVYENAPIGSIIVPLPDSAPEDMDRMRGAFRGRRGATLVVEGVAQATAAGMNPQLNRTPDQLGPDLQRSMTDATQSAAREAIAAAYGVIPAFLNRSATGPVIREAQRHLAQWQLQPIAELLAEEAGEKLGTAIRIDLTRPLQAFDTGGRARAMSAIIGALAQAKEAGIDPNAALALVDWNRPRE